MNPTDYLVSYGWTPGTGFKKGSLAKPILVRHKQDTKGLGSAALEHETWWERVFDGRLQNLDVFSKTVETGEADSAVNVRGARDSPLYSMFVKGEGLSGSALQPDGRRTEISIETDVITRTSTEMSVVTEITETRTVRKKRDRKRRHESAKNTQSDQKWVRQMLKEMKKKQKRS